MKNNTDIIVTDKRMLFRGEGSSGLEIKDAAAQAEAVLDTKSNALRDDAVFVPMGDRVTVKRIEEAEFSLLGITVPGTAKTPPAFGVVVGVGQGRYNLVGQLIPLRVRAGAVVMFGKYAGTDAPIFGVGGKDRQLLILREEEIFGVIMSKEDYERVRVEADPEIAGVAK